MKEFTFSKSKIELLRRYFLISFSTVAEPIFYRTPSSGCLCAFLERKKMKYCFYCAQSGILCGIANFSQGKKNKLTFLPQKWKILRTASLKQNLLVLIKKQCNTNDVRTLNDLPINWENLPIFRWVSSFFTLISMLNCQNIHTAKNTESVQEKLSAIFLKKHRRWGSPFTASDCYLQLVFTPTMFMKQIYNMYSNASKLKRN